MLGLSFSIQRELNSFYQKHLVFINDFKKIEVFDETLHTIYSGVFAFVFFQLKS